MFTDTDEIKATTPGEWIVTTIDEQIAVVQTNEFNSIQKTIATFGDEDSINANEHIANAALLATSKDMLDALIAIQESVNSSDGIDTETVNEMLQGIFKKLANEAGEEL